MFLHFFRINWPHHNKETENSRPLIINIIWNANNALLNIIEKIGHCEWSHLSLYGNFVSSNFKSIVSVSISSIQRWKHFSWCHLVFVHFIYQGISAVVMETDAKRSPHDRNKTKLDRGYILKYKELFMNQFIFSIFNSAVSIPNTFIKREWKWNWLLKLIWGRK